jgi:hypothetical protein
MPPGQLAFQFEMNAAAAADAVRVLAGEDSSTSVTTLPFSLLRSQLLQTFVVAITMDLTK